MRVVVFRDGKTETLRVTLGRREDAVGDNAGAESGEAIPDALAGLLERAVVERISMWRERCREASTARAGTLRHSYVPGQERGGGDPATPALPAVPDTGALLRLRSRFPGAPE